MPETPAGQIILLNGASSAGKSTLCRALQRQLPVPFLQFSLDFLMFGGPVLPERREASGPFSWAAQRPRLFEGWFRCLAALASAGNRLVVDFIIETPEQLERLHALLGDFDVYLVGVHCPLPELERRERLRGDRPAGDARRDLETVHTFTAYDLDVDSSGPPEAVAAQIISGWLSHAGPRGLRRLPR
jgi:chloramphenicol 3-O phosphotransferase